MCDEHEQQIHELESELETLTGALNPLPSEIMDEIGEAAPNTRVCFSIELWRDPDGSLRRRFQVWDHQATASTHESTRAALAAWKLARLTP